MLIYMVTNRINGKCYVGQTVFTLNHRKKQHVYNALAERNTFYFDRSIRKYGPDNFTWTTLHDDITTIEFLNQLEIFYIGYYNTFEDGYNLTEGGAGSIGYKHTEISLKKMSKVQKGKNHPFYGKHHSDESKRKMSEARMGKKLSRDTRKKMSEARKGQHNISKTFVINGKQFDTLKKAAKYIGVSQNTIRYRILHKTRWSEYKYI